MPPSPRHAAKALRQVVPGTYNQMSVDLDTSTNDTLLILASGLAGNPEITAEADYDAFVAALTAIAEVYVRPARRRRRGRHPPSSPAMSPAHRT